MTDTIVSSSSPMDKEQRLAHYVEFLQKMKERNSLRQFMLREMLLELIKINRKNINEFPLLETQQKSIINLLAQRESDHPGHLAIMRHIETFAQLLTQYEKERDVSDNEALQFLKSKIFNVETLLIKCVQGVVYVTCLIIDDFSDVIISHFGEKSIDTINDFTKKHNFNHEFWKAHLEFFIERRIVEAYSEIIENRLYRITRNQSMILLVFPLDAVLKSIGKATSEIQKTRIQQLFTNNRKDVHKRQVQLVITEHLLESWEKIFGPRSSAGLAEYLAEVISMDPLGEQFAQEFARSLGLEFSPDSSYAVSDVSMSASSALKAREEESEEEREARVGYIEELLVAMALGVTIALDLVRTDFLKALSDLKQQDLKAINRLLGQFEPPSLQRTFYFIIQSRFQELLREKAGEEIKRIQVRSISVPRVSAAEVDALAEQGLTRIRRKQLFDPDPHREDRLLFKPRQAEELLEIMSTFQVEEPLRQSLQELWLNAGAKVEVLVGIDLKQLARVSTNLKARLAGILQNFGITAAG